MSSTPCSSQVIKFHTSYVVCGIPYNNIIASLSLSVYGAPRRCQERREVWGRRWRCREGSRRARCWTSPQSMRRAAAPPHSAQSSAFPRALVALKQGTGYRSRRRRRGSPRPSSRSCAPSERLWHALPPRAPSPNRGCPSSASASRTTAHRSGQGTFDPGSAGTAPRRTSSPALASPPQGQHPRACGQTWRCTRGGCGT